MGHTRDTSLSVPACVTSETALYIYQHASHKRQQSLSTSVGHTRGSSLCIYWHESHWRQKSPSTGMSNTGDSDLYLLSLVMHTLKRQHPKTRLLACPPWRGRVGWKSMLKPCLNWQLLARPPWRGKVGWKSMLKPCFNRRIFTFHSLLALFAYKFV